MRAIGALHATSFLRPVTGPGDVSDLLTGTAITVALTATGRLRVAASASRRRIDAGELVRFSAAVEGAAAGEDVRVSWAFDDGATGSGTHVRHRFRRPGTYKVVVGATSDANPAGASAIVTIRVGQQDEDAPDHEGGGTDSDEDAPDSGAASGAGAGPGTNRAGARSRANRARGRERRARSSRRERRAESPRADDGGDEVAGVLLDDPGSLPPVAAHAAARTGTPDAGRPLDLPPEALAGLAALSLLGLGAWRERPVAHT